MQQDQPTFLIVAAEASGDLHGAKLMEAMRRSQPGIRFVGMGGPAMRGAGLEALHQAEELSVMGFVEVVPKLAKILQILQSLGRWAQKHRPSAAILIDSADFNLRLARSLKEVGIPTVAYIAPMAWAWRESRVRALRDLDRVLCIYPFEERWFRRRGVAASYVGNPLVEAQAARATPERAEARALLDLHQELPTLALLPGSRKAEVEQLLPTLLDAADILAKRLPALQVILPIAPTLERERVEALTSGRPSEPLLVEGNSLEAMAAADAVAVCSGTATLEAALLGTPMAVVYRAHPISWRILMLFIRVRFASIVNLLADDALVPELLQERFEAGALADTLEPLLLPSAERERMIERLAALSSLLGSRPASEGAALEILSLVGALDREGPTGSLLQAPAAV